MALARLGRWLDGIASHPLTTLDLAWVGRARILVCMIIWADVARRWALRHAMGPPRGLLSDALGQAIVPSPAPSLALGIQAPEGMAVYVATLAMALAAMTIGWCTQRACIAVLVLFGGLVFQHPAQCTPGALGVLGAVFWLCMVPAGARASVDHWLHTRAGGRGGPHALQTVWAWTVPLFLLLSACASGSVWTSPRLRWWTPGASRLASALSEGVALPAGGQQMLVFGGEAVTQVDLALDGTTLLAVLLLCSPVFTRWTRVAGVGLLVITSVAISSIVWIDVTAWAPCVLTVALLGPWRARAGRTGTTRTRGREGLSLWRRGLGEALGVAAVIFLLGRGAGMMTHLGDGLDRAGSDTAVTSLEDMRRGAVNRHKVRVFPLEIAIGPWSNAPVLDGVWTAEVHDASGARWVWDGGDWQDISGESRAPETWRERILAAGMSAIAGHLYTYGGLELERLAWGPASRVGRCDGTAKAEGICAERLELMVRRRTDSQSMSLGDPTPAFYARRDVPSRAFVTRGSGAPR